MSNPILFIETPRAGKHNHRFIVPKDYTGGDGTLSHWADLARSQAQGSEYFSAQSQVTQQTGGRTGVEQLILAGVDAQWLAKHIKTIHTVLQRRLPDVERLVTQSIDWDHQSNNIVLRTELTQWQLDLEQQLGGAIPAATGIPVKQVQSKRGWFVYEWFMREPLVFWSTMVIILAAAVAANSDCRYDLKCWTQKLAEQGHHMDGKNNPTGSPGQPINEQPPANSPPPAEAANKSQAAPEQMDRLIKAIGGNTDEVKKEIPTNITMPKAGEPWPMSMFVSNADSNTGRDFVQLLWDKPLGDNLKIADSKIEPLMQCRKAIRDLMGVTGEIHTPFFDAGDFGKATNQFVALHESVLNWAIEPLNKGAIINNQGKPNCNSTTPPKTDLIKWINACLGAIDNKEGYKNLKPIMGFGEACGSVQFISAKTP